MCLNRAPPDRLAEAGRGKRATFVMLTNDFFSSIHTRRPCFCDPLTITLLMLSFVSVRKSQKPQQPPAAEEQLALIAIIGSRSPGKVMVFESGGIRSDKRSAQTEREREYAARCGDFFQFPFGRRAHEFDISGPGVPPSFARGTNSRERGMKEPHMERERGFL